MTATVTQLIRTPTPPNFVQTTTGHPVDVADLSDTEIEALAHALRMALLENVAKRRMRRRT